MIQSWSGSSGGKNLVANDAETAVLSSLQDGWDAHTIIGGKSSSMMRL